MTKQLIYFSNPVVKLLAIHNTIHCEDTYNEPDIGVNILPNTYIFSYTHVQF